MILRLTIDASQSQEDIEETIVHEFTLHGANIDKMIDIYRTQGTDAAIDFFYQTSGKEEHLLNKPLYDTTMKELEQNKEKEQ